MCCLDECHLDDEGLTIIAFPPTVLISHGVLDMRICSLFFSHNWKPAHYVLWYRKLRASQPGWHCIDFFMEKVVGQGAKQAHPHGYVNCVLSGWHWRKCREITWGNRSTLMYIRKPALAHWQFLSGPAQNSKVHRCCDRNVSNLSDAFLRSSISILTMSEM